MSGVVVDTHAFVWYLLESPRLSRPARERIEASLSAGEPLLLPVICIVELIYLVEKGRIPAADWTTLEQDLGRADSAVRIVPLTESIARAVAHVPREAVPDMPDRIIAATALDLGLPLVSRDHRIRLTTLDVVW